MPSALVAQALALASAAGISAYGTVALLGLAARLGWIGPLPEALAPVQAWWVIGLAGTLYLAEFLATLVPGIASAWEALHTAVRPLAGAALAAATVYQGNPGFTLVAALLGGTLALGTNATKLGARVAIDASPEPFTNGAANVAELGVFASIALLAYHHPYIALTVAVVALVLAVLFVRTVLRAMRNLARRAAGRARSLTA
jgi:heme exporter protein D